jgi:hypothetical protein
MKWLIPILALAACDKDNVNYCNEPMVHCAVGVCNQTTHECESPDGGTLPDFAGTDFSLDFAPGLDFSGIDLAGADLTQGCTCSGTTPICQTGGVCVACGSAAGGGEAACLALSTTAPHCLTSGACGQCRNGADCSDVSKSICDSTTHMCRGCTADSDCTSMVCDLTPASPTIGQCVTGVIYVDCMNGNDTNTGKTLAMANKTVSKGVANAKADGYPVVRISANGGAACAGENLVIMDSITLVGETGATIKPATNANNNPALDVKGSAVVVLRNLTFSSGVGTNGNGITCETSGSLTVLQCTVTNNLQYGIEDNGCPMITIDRSYIGALSGGNGSQQGGIYLAHNFRVTNNFIIKNGNSGGGPSGGGVVIMSPSTAVPRDFNSNTVVNNIGSGPGAGVSCPAAAQVTVLNSILFGNTASALPSESNCPTSYCDDDGAAEINQTNNINVSPGFATAGDYHIGATSMVRSKGTATGVSNHDYDGQPRPDPSTGMVDIGADQYYP